VHLYFVQFLFISANCSLVTGGGAKKSEYKIITAADKEIAAMTFLVSIIF
jgi:hypothetical protein